jgi:hypothetical protein
MKTKLKPKLKPEVWVDFLENELDPKFKGNLEELLSQDMNELKYVLELRDVINELKNLKPKPLLPEPSPEFWASLKGKIMQKISVTEIHPPAPRPEPQSIPPEDLPPQIKPNIPHPRT